MTQSPAANPTTQSPYLALPAAGTGPGVLVLHAWWGLTPFFTGLCDRLAGEGFVALAPSLYPDNATADTIEEAERLVRSFESMDGTSAAVYAALDQLKAQPALTSPVVGVVGFSMGAYWSIHLSTARAADIAAAVVFYGVGEGDFTKARAAYQGHFAEVDEWEPIEGVREFERSLRAAGREVELHFYPGGHWFFESNRPDAYNQEAADLAWQRTVAFLRRHLAAS